MSLSNIGDELGMWVRMRQVLELIVNGGAAASIDSITQLISEAEADYDTDATSKDMLPTVIGFLNQWRNAQNELLAACDRGAFACMRARMAADIDSVSLSNDIRGLVGDFDHYLRDNTKVIQKTTPAAGGTVTAGGTNTGTGTALISILDTFNKNNQSIQNGADYWFACTEDAITGGANQHAERFSLQSSFSVSFPSVTACMYPDDDGAGDMGGGNRLQNEDGITTPGTGNTNADTTIPFENFTTNTPDCWTIDTGAAGTQVLEESTEYYFGSKCLEIVGDAGGTLTELSQDANHFFGATSTDQKLDPLAHYAIGWYGKSADTTGKIAVYLDGTGYTAGTTEKATYDFGGSGALASWTLTKAVVKMPKAIPPDMKAIIKVETALGNGVSAYIDGVFLAKMYHSEVMGIDFAVIPGSTAFVYDERDPDRLHFDSTNDWDGLYQEFFARRTDPRDITRLKYCDIGMHVNSDTAADAEMAETKAA